MRLRARESKAGDSRVANVIFVVACYVSGVIYFYSSDAVRFVVVRLLSIPAVIGGR